MDITLCKEEKCLNKETCLRYKSEPNKIWQSYFNGSPLVGGECAYYIKFGEKPLYDINIQYKQLTKE
jgi:hypothetical protein